MFIWCAISLEDELASLNKECKRIGNELNYQFDNFTLPSHISLKISAPIGENDLNLIINELEKYFHKCNSFEIIPDKIELANDVVWLRMKTNKFLEKMHQEICNLLYKKFDIPNHLYDLKFIFHSTLFYSLDHNILHKAFELVKDKEIPSKLTFSKFLIGSSEDGLASTFKINKIVDIQ